MHFSLQRKNTSVISEYLDTRSIQENLDLLTSFIQDSANKHIPWKTSRSVFSIPWITPEIRRKIRRKNKSHAKKTGHSNLRSKFETLRRDNKADISKQHDLYVNNLVGDDKANPRDLTSIGTPTVRKKTSKAGFKSKTRPLVFTSELVKGE